jgi:opacity protein-like surface antigen
MRRHSLKSFRWTALAAVACLAAVAGPAHAEGEGAFLNADVGASFIPHLSGGVHADPGVRFSLVPGYRIHDDDTLGISLQFETGVIWNATEMTPGGGTGGILPPGGFGAALHADLYQVPFLAGIEFSFHASRAVVPYIGVAGGGSYTEWQTHESVAAALGQSSSEDTENQTSVSGAVQGAAGVRIKLNEHMELGVGYKFLNAFPPEVNYIGTHSASVTFVWRF